MCFLYALRKIRYWKSRCAIAVMMCEQNLLDVNDPEFRECGLEGSSTRLNKKCTVTITEDTCIDMPMMNVKVMAELRKAGLHWASSFTVGALCKRAS